MTTIIVMVFGFIIEFIFIFNFYLLICYVICHSNFFFLCFTCVDALLFGMARFLSCHSSSVHRFIYVLYLERVLFNWLGCLSLNYNVAFWALFCYIFLAFSLAELAISQYLWLPKLFITFILSHSLVHLLITIARSQSAFRLILRECRFYPWMFHSFTGRKSTHWINLNTIHDKVKKL